MAYEVVMATARCTQACFHAAGTHAVLHPQGECWESEVEGQGWRGQKLWINCVESTVMTQCEDASLVFICFGVSFSLVKLHGVKS